MASTPTVAMALEALESIARELDDSAWSNHTHRSQLQQFATLRAFIESSGADAERLDWCEKQWPDGLHLETCAANSGLTHHGLHQRSAVYLGLDEHAGSTLRAAIDAARSLPPQQKE